jgi:hypothetical protein
MLFSEKPQNCLRRHRLAEKSELQNYECMWLDKYPFAEQKASGFRD